MVKSQWFKYLLTKVEVILIKTTDFLLTSSNLCIMAKYDEYEKL